MEEQQYALEKGRRTPSGATTASSSATELYPGNEQDDSHALKQHSLSAASALPMEGSGLRGAGHIFFTRYGRGRTASSTSSGFSSSSPSRGTFHVVSPSRSSCCCRVRKRLLIPHEPPCLSPCSQATPGPGQYEPDAKNSITSILGSNADKPQSIFRSRTSRFDYNKDVGRFKTADPLHLEPASAIRRTPSAAAASPFAFRRGGSIPMLSK